MADTATSALTELTTLATDDEFPIVDTSETETKRVTVDTLQTGITVTSTQVSDFGEAVDDRISTTIVEGAGVSLVYDDGADTLTVSAVTAPVAVTGTTDTLAAADNGRVNYYTDSSAVTVTLPTDASDDLADGFECLLVATGAGGLSLSTTGVTLIGDSPATTAAQDESIYVKKTSTANTWLVIGPATGDPDILKADTYDTITAGFDSSDFAAGTKSSGTYTPAASNGNFQVATNGGAHTLAPPSTSCSIVIHYTNNGSAGAITTSGFTAVTGDSFTTTDTHEFVCVITKINDVSVLNVTALQ